MRLRYRLLLLLLGAAGVALFLRMLVRPQPPESDAVVVRMAHSGDMQPWLEAAVREFRGRHPEIRIQLVNLGSLEAVQSIAGERELPLVWSPADPVALDLLDQEWRRTHGGSPAFARDGGDAPQPLLLSPLVWVAWEERGPMLARGADRPNGLSWSLLHQALTAPRGWAELGGDPSWGPIKLGFEEPTRSSLGLQALELMALERAGYPLRLTAADLAREDVQRWLQDFRALAVPGGASGAPLLDDMLRYGPSRLDVVCTYESLAIRALEHLPKDRWGKLRVYYPPSTLWSDHPVTMLAVNRWNEEQRAAARLWIRFLLGPTMQQKALAYGFRPADPALPLPPAEQNPFERFKAAGLELRVTSAPGVPDAAMARQLLETWDALPRASRPAAEPRAGTSGP